MRSPSNRNMHEWPFRFTAIPVTYPHFEICTLNGTAVNRNTHFCILYHQGDRISSHNVVQGFSVKLVQG